MVLRSRRRYPAFVADGVVAGIVAGAVSGLPSTLYALASGRPTLEATYAAGHMILPRERSTPKLVAAAALVHGVISAGWGIVLARALPRRGTVAAGAAAGLGVAVFDLAVVGRRLFPAVARLPQPPQYADHLLYGAVCGVVLRRRRRRS